MSHISILLYVYAALLLIGGVIGYAKAKSGASLGAGIGSAIAAAVAGVLAGSQPHLGMSIGATLSIALVIVFSRRYQKTKNPMPAIPMIVASILVVAVCAYSLGKGHGA